MSALPNFNEIRALADALPAYDSKMRDVVRSSIVTQHGPDYADDADMAGWLAGAQRRNPPALVHPRVALFAAVHGVAADLDRGSRETIAAELAALVEGTGDLHRLVAARDADLRVYELALDMPTQDSRAGPAMRADEAARAVAYGMMAIEPGLDAVVLSSLGLGGDMAAAAICAALSPGMSVTSPHGDRMAEAVTRHSPARDPLALLAALGGPDIAAMVGAILAARLAGAAIILDGDGARAAGALVKRLRADGIDHCLDAGQGAEPPRAGLAALDMLDQACALIPA
jgi:nicotinate-nucleotide--dimethylbenzimidazole phosphoribosyltransferase